MNPITPYEALPRTAAALGFTELYAKREDLHPLGSHKGRSIPFMIDAAYVNGARRFVISSSGNAALAALEYIKATHSDAILHILIGENIETEKESEMKNLIGDAKNITIEKVTRPLQTLLQKEKEGFVSLRQSTDLLALTGYQSLANELRPLRLGSIFVPASSGTLAEALGSNFPNVKLFAVQTSSNNTLVKTFDTVETEEQSIAHAIIDIVGFRRESLAKIISETQGAGFIATNTHIAKAIELLKEDGIEATPNGALGLAGLLRAKEKGLNIPEPICIIVTGK